MNDKDTFNGDGHENERSKDGPKRLAVQTIDPDEVEEMAKTSPVLAAYECRKGVTLLEVGAQKARRRFIAASYLITYNIKHNEKELEWFAFNYQTAGFAQKQDTDKTRDRLIYQVYEFIFSQIEGVTENRAYSYAHALESYLKHDAAPDQVKAVVMERGPEKLYREALERNKLAKAMSKYRESGRDPSGTIDESYFLEMQRDDEEKVRVHMGSNTGVLLDKKVADVVGHTETNALDSGELDDNDLLPEGEGEADEDNDDLLNNDGWDSDEDDGFLLNDEWNAEEDDEQEDNEPVARNGLREEWRSEILQLVLQLEAGLNDLRNRIRSL